MNDIAILSAQTGVVAGTAAAVAASPATSGVLPALQAAGTFLMEYVVAPVLILSSFTQVSDVNPATLHHEKDESAKTEEAKPAKEKAKDRRARESEESRENKSEAKRPGDNKRQNQQFKDATRDMSPKAKQKLHEQMKKMEQLDYRDLVNEANRWKCL